MATKTLINGTVDFNGLAIELGKPVLINGRRAVPFMAWVRDDAEATYCGLQPKPHTDVRFKFEKGSGYRLEDFNTRYGKRAVIEQVGA